MNNKNFSVAQVWKDFEDLLAPRLHFPVNDRVVYYHLFRHSRLEGKLRFSFTMPWLARGTGLCRQTVRESVRRLISRGVLDLIERNPQGYVVRVRLPEELRVVRSARIAASHPVPPPRTALSIEDTDFMQTQPLRRVIHQREGGRCFYCSRRLNPRRRCLDHVVPRAHSGDNSYRNLVSCCPDCNAQKGALSAEEHLRALFRDRRLSDAELTSRLRALDDLAAGKLKPPLPGQG
ncbi:MAG TPA: HNH endonuclease [Candidatus Acidoferrum sp.]|nr:HNH endonuclease [Candidatus Acidoferrum sp.]